jgi:hypothetical protein
MSNFVRATFKPHKTTSNNGINERKLISPRVECISSQRGIERKQTVPSSGSGEAGNHEL